MWTNSKVNFKKLIWEAYSEIRFLQKHLRGVCSISLVACHLRSRGCSAIVLSCHHARVQNIFSWVPNFLSWVFRGSQFFLVGNYFVGPRFSLAGNFVILSSWPNEKKWLRNIFETTYLIPNQFQELWIVIILQRYFIY